MNANNWFDSLQTKFFEYKMILKKNLLKQIKIIKPFVVTPASNKPKPKFDLRTLKAFFTR